jgi:hypothetical protein
MIRDKIILDEVRRDERERAWNSERREGEERETDKQVFQ